MAGAIRPMTLISVARNEIASGSLVVERISSPTRDRTSWAGIPSRTRSRKALKKYACSMYSSRSRTGMGAHSGPGGDVGAGPIITRTRRGRAGGLDSCPLVESPEGSRRNGPGGRVPAIGLEVGGKLPRAWVGTEVPGGHNVRV